MASANEPVLVIGLGGTQRQGSSTELAIRAVLRAAERRNAHTRIFAADDLDLPMYRPGDPARTDKAEALVEALRRADAIVLGSPGYHGGISGLVKNAIDYTEDMSRDARVYFDGMPVACVATGAGFQGANATLTALRAVTHALRGWPVPLGLALNSQTPLFDAEGTPLDTGLATQIDQIGEQVVRMARAMGRSQEAFA